MIIQTFLKYRIIIFVSLIILGCTSELPSMDKAGNEYKNSKDYASLLILHKHLSKNMPRQEIEILFGKPDYSPTEGLYYYSSNKNTYSDIQNKNVPVGLILDYRDKNGIVTEFLQEYILGAIGE